MARRGRRRKKLTKAASSIHHQNPLTTNPHPYFDQVSLSNHGIMSQRRQLRRFYEPLILLYTLGGTRGEHTKGAFSADDTPCFSTQESRRRFLNELAYMCDYNKGGDTVTAIGLEFKPQNYVFWVASNTCPENKIVPFLDSLLNELKRLDNGQSPPNPDDVEKIAARCIEFATLRIKKYRALLRTALSKYHTIFAAQLDGEEGEQYDLVRSFLSTVNAYNQKSGVQLSRWLAILEMQSSELDLCRFAYNERKSDAMRRLARLSVEPKYKTDIDAMHNVFRSIRHYVGRLGHHFRAANALLSCTLLSDLLHDFEIRGIATPAKSALPLPVSKTDFESIESIMGRILPAHSPLLTHYQKALQEMDSKYGLSNRFKENYTNENARSRVHAEIQVLDYFHTNRITFAENDRFIACSKPACFCCSLYFRYHPGRFAEPTSHRKIYLNWRPPDIIAGNQVHGKVQRDILNNMTHEIRKDALKQIDERAAPHAWHPDSLTGITDSMRERLRTEWKSSRSVSSTGATTTLGASLGSIEEWSSLKEANHVPRSLYSGSVYGGRSNATENIMPRRTDINEYDSESGGIEI